MLAGDFSTRDRPAGSWRPAQQAYVELDACDMLRPACPGRRHLVRVRHHIAMLWQQACKLQTMETKGNRGARRTEVGEGMSGVLVREKKAATVR